MPAFLAPLAIAGISAFGNFLANRKKTTEQTQDTTNRSTGTVNTTANINDMSTTRPDMNPETLTYLNNIRDRYTALLDQDPNLAGYEASGISNINRAGDLRSRAIQNVLAARGLSYSPMAGGAMAGAESSRVSDTVNFQNQIPLLRDKLMRERLAEAGQFFSRIPMGQTVTNTGQRTGTETRDLATTGNMKGTNFDPGNPMAGLFGGLGSSLAYLYGQGAFEKKSGTQQAGQGGG